MRISSKLHTHTSPCFMRLLHLLFVILEFMKQAIKFYYKTYE